MTKKILTAFGAVALSLLGAAAASATNAHDARPDLVIRSADLYATGHCDGLRPEIVGDIVIKNRGNARAKALLISPIVRVEDSRDGRFRDAEVKINSLAPGESLTTRVRLGTLRNSDGFKGARLIRIKADPRGKIQESNERNNTYAVRVRTHCH